MDERPLAFREQGLEVVLGIAAFVSRCSVADFEVHDLPGSFVYQAVTVARAGLEACAHSRRELGPTLVGVQRRPPFQDVDELVLLAVGVTKGRNCIGSQAREVYAKVRQAEKIAQSALLPAPMREANGSG